MHDNILALPSLSLMRRMIIINMGEYTQGDATAQGINKFVVPAYADDGTGKSQCGVG